MLGAEYFRVTPFSIVKLAQRLMYGYKMNVRSIGAEYLCRRSRVQTVPMIGDGTFRMVEVVMNLVKSKTNVGTVE